MFILWWKLSSDENYLVMKVIIVKDVLTCDIWPVAMFERKIPQQLRAPAKPTCWAGSSCGTSCHVGLHTLRNKFNRKRIYQEGQSRIKNTRNPKRKSISCLNVYIRILPQYYGWVACEDCGSKEYESGIKKVVLKAGVQRLWWRVPGLDGE